MMISKIRRQKLVVLVFVLALMCGQFVSGQTTDQAKAVLNEAFGLLQQGTNEAYRASLPKFQKAIGLFLQLNDKDSAGMGMVGAGLSSHRLGEMATALEFYDKALPLFQAVGNKQWEGITLNNIALVYNETGEKRKALEYFQHALRFDKASGDRAGEATTLKNIGDVYDSLGEKRKALEYYDRALPIFKAVGKTAQEATVLNDIGITHNELGESRAALDYLNQALPLFKLIGDKGGEATALNNIGSVRERLGEKQKALELYKQALLIFRSVGNTQGTATALNNIGQIHDNLGEKQKALEFYEQALAFFRTAGDKGGEAKALNNIGKIYNSTGEKYKALEFVGEALSLSKTPGDKTVEATALNDLGLIYDDLGEKQKALEYYEQALPLFKIIEDKRGEATTLSGIGGIHLSLGEEEKALKFFGQAVALFKALEDKRGEANAYNSIGGIYDSTGQNQLALEYYARALVLFKAVGNREGETATLNNIGGLHLSSGDHPKALEFYIQALPLTKLIGNKQFEATTLSNIMIVWTRLQNPRIAVFYGKQAVRKYQELRTSSRDLENETQKTFLKGIQHSYQILAELLIGEGLFDQAIQVLSLYQDQQFFDFNREADFSPTRRISFSPREQELADRYETASDKMSKISSEIGELNRKTAHRSTDRRESAELEKLEAELKTATDDFLAVLTDSAREFTQKPDEKDSVPPIKEVALMRNSLGDLSASTKRKTATLYTFIGESNFHILLLSPEGQVKHFNSPIKRDDLNEKFLRFYRLLRSPYYNPRIAGKELYELIFQPVEVELEKQKVKTLLWQLDGTMRYIPVAALFDGEKYLAEKYQTVVFTRADTERLLKTVKPVWTGTGFGSSKEQTVELLGDRVSFSALPGVALELDSIFQTGKDDRGVIGGEVISDQKFTRESFYESLRQKRPVVHISSHFAFRPGDDTRSFLLLGDGTPLTLSEMKEQADLFEEVDLLTLSACNTAAARADANGREIDGFAELAQRLGANAVMATLWAVADESTAILMTEFYRLKQENPELTKAEAIQIVQKSMIEGEFKSSQKWLKERSKSVKTKEDNLKAPLYKFDETHPFAHPYYWSPFVLFGNWK